jgi:hypothetical protein
VFQAFVLIFISMALNMQFQSLAPQYASFGDQFYLKSNVRKISSLTLHSLRLSLDLFQK